MGQSEPFFGYFVGTDGVPYELQHAENPVRTDNNHLAISP